MVTCPVLLLLVINSLYLDDAYLQINMSCCLILYFSSDLEAYHPIWLLFYADADLCEDFDRQDYHP